jgi:hypothetical protein
MWALARDIQLAQADGVEPGACIGPVEGGPSLEGPKVCLLRHVFASSASCSTTGKRWTSPG